MAERVFVDRVEDEQAVLLFGAEGRETGTLPARLLPPGAGEGTALDLSLAPAPGDTTRDEVKSLMDEMFAAPAEPEGGARP